MLLSVRQDFPQPGEELDPRLFSQRGGDVAELDEGAQQGSRLQEERPVWRPALATRVLPQPPAQEAPRDPLLSRRCPLPDAQNLNRCCAKGKHELWAPQTPPAVLSSWHDSGKGLSDMMTRLTSQATS